VGRETPRLNNNSWCRQDYANVSAPRLSCCRWEEYAHTRRSLVVDEFLEDMEEGDALVYFYCKYDEFERRNPESILRALVKQLTLASSQPPEPVASIYEQRRTGGFLSGPLTLEESKRLLVELIGSFGQTVICIDALDECDKNTRKQLLDVLTDLLRLSSRPVKIYVTSRDDDDIVLHLDVFPNISIRSHDTSADIEYFVHTEIEKRIANNRLLRGNVDPELKSHIKSTLCSRASGMYGSSPFACVCPQTY